MHLKLHNNDLGQNMTEVTTGGRMIKYNNTMSTSAAPFTSHLIHL